MGSIGNFIGRLLGRENGPPRRVKNHAVYEGGSTGRRARGWIAPASGPNQSATAVAQNLRNRSRGQYRNNPYGKSGVNSLVSNIIGTGIKPLSMADDPNFRANVQRLWEQWASESDPEGVLSFYGQQAQMANAWLQGGEAFARMRLRRSADGLSVPLQIQITEPELVPIDWTMPRGGNEIISGVEFNPVQQRVAYWFYRSHPGDIRFDRDARPRPVRASEVIHLYDPVRPGQVRGIVQMAPVLLKMHDLDKFDDATLLRQQIANLYAAFVTRNVDEDDDDSTDPIMGRPVDTDEDPIGIGLEPGIIDELGPNEDIKFSEPPDPASTYGDFLRQQLMAVAAGLEMPYEVLVGDWRGINDRIARVILNEFRRRIQQIQHHIIVHQFCRRVWNAWLDRAVLSGAIDAPGYALDRERYARVRWMPQGWAYIHPVQDVQAEQAAMRAGLKSRSESAAERGRDAEDIDREIAEDNARSDGLGLTFDSDGRNSVGGGSKKAEERDDAEQET